MTAQPHEARSSQPEDVFVFRIGQFGDTVVALPAIHRIAQMHPAARLTLITNAPSAKSLVTAWDVLQHTGLFARVVFYESSSWRALVKLARACRSSPNAVLYYLSPRRSWSQMVRDYAFFRVACGLTETRGFARAPQPSLRDAQGRLRVLPREWERLLRVVDPAAETPPAPLLAPSPDTERRADELLTPLSGKRLIALGPGSKMPAKKWFLARYQQVVKQLVETYPDLAIVVFGGAEDRSEGDSFVLLLGPDHALNLAGTTNIVESAAALRRCTLYIGNDTGTMHLAAVMGVPCVALFTSRDNPDVWVPWGEAHEILRRELPCSGCMLVTCEKERMRCLSLISVDDVLTASHRKLRAS